MLASWATFVAVLILYLVDDPLSNIILKLVRFLAEAGGLKEMLGVQVFIMV